MFVLIDLLSKKKEADIKNILEDTIKRFVGSLYENENIGIVSQLVYEDDLSELVRNLFLLLFREK